MKVREFIERVDRSNPETPSLDDLMRECEVWGSAWEIPEQRYVERLEYHWLQAWYCTDSWVGCRVYFLDDEPICMSSQGGRKCEEEFEWVDEAAFLRTREFLQELVASVESLGFGLIDMDEELPADGWTCDYVCQLLDDELRYEGERRKVVRKPGRRDPIKNTVTLLIDGEEKEVDLKDCKVPWRITGDR